MEVELIGAGDIFPNGGGEEAFPVVGGKQLSVFVPSSFAEVIIAAFFGSRILEGFLEPGMFIGSVVENEVDEDEDIPGMCLLEESFEIFVGSITRIDVVIRRNVISVIVHGGFEQRANPNQPDSKTLQIIQFGDDAGDVPDAIVVGIVK